MQASPLSSAQLQAGPGRVGEPPLLLPGLRRPVAQFPFLYQPPPSTRGNESGQTRQLGNLTHWELGEGWTWREIVIWVPQTKPSVSHPIAYPPPPKPAGGPGTFSVVHSLGLPPPEALVLEYGVRATSDRQLQLSEGGQRKAGLPLCNGWCSWESRKGKAEVGVTLCPALPSTAQHCCSIQKFGSFSCQKGTAPSGSLSRGY